jgi:hypothetical protein
MTAPGPVAGANPYTLGYQTEQFSTAVPIKTKSVLDSLATPPAAGIAAETTPTHVFNTRDHPPIGAGGNEPTGNGGLY